MDTNEGFREYEGKRVFIKLRNGREYSGEIYAVESKGAVSLIKLKDKFGKNVGFYDTEISVIEVEVRR